MLSERSREILAFIQWFTREKGYPPTIREIGEKFAISSTNGVRYHTELLLKAGHLEHSDRISRGLRPVERGLPRTNRVPVGIPVLGRVAAGQPILAEENLEGTIDADQMFGDLEGLFALRVRGDSMIDAGILEGDYVIVRGQERANAGEIVVGLIGDEATVKYFQPRRGGIELVAANAKYAPIQVGPDDGFRILGVVRGVIRTVGR
jgi:repressor LexA